VLITRVRLVGDQVRPVGDGVILVGLVVRVLVVGGVIPDPGSVFLTVLDEHTILGGDTHGDLGLTLQANLVADRHLVQVLVPILHQEVAFLLAPVGGLLLGGLGRRIPVMSLNTVPVGAGVLLDVHDVPGRRGPHSVLLGVQDLVTVLLLLEDTEDVGDQVVGLPTPGTQPGQVLVGVVGGVGGEHILGVDLGVDQLVAGETGLTGGSVGLDPPVVVVPGGPLRLLEAGVPVDVVGVTVGVDVLVPLDGVLSLELRIQDLDLLGEEPDSITKEIRHLSSVGLVFFFFLSILSSIFGV